MHTATCQQVTCVKNKEPEKVFKDNIQSVYCQVCFEKGCHTYEYSLSYFMIDISTGLYVCQLTCTCLVLSTTRALCRIKKLPFTLFCAGQVYVNC